MDKKIQKLSLHISNFYQEKTKCTNEFREELHFCLQYFIFNITVLSTILIINSIFGLFKECILVLITFMCLRSSSGGFHCDTYGKCYIISNAYILLFSWLTHILIPYYIPCCVIACILGFYIYHRYVPKSNEHDENLFITKQEKKKRFLKTLTILNFIMFVGIFFEFKLITIGIALGMISVAWMTSNKGERFFRTIQNYI